MGTLNRYLLIFCLGLMMGATAFAQDTHKNEVGLLLGAEFVPSRNTAAGSPIDFSRSIVFSANYARQLAGDSTSVLLEFPFAAAPSHKVRSSQTGLITDLGTLFVTPSLRLQFKKHSSLSPWISGGFGYGQYEGSTLLSGDTSNPDVRQHIGTVQFGGGVDIRTPIRILFPIGLRAEVRDYYTLSAPSFGVPIHDNGQHNVVAAGGIVIRF